MGPIGVQELVVIFLVALVLFGPKKLPELGRTIAKAVTEFRRAQTELKATFDREMANLERETASAIEPMRQAAVEIGGFSDELSASANYNGDSHGSQNQIAAPSTVSASETSGAESHADDSQLGLFAESHDPAAAHNGAPPSGPSSGEAPPIVAAEGAVPRTEVAAIAQTPPAEPAQPESGHGSNPQPETVQHS